MIVNCPSCRTRFRYSADEAPELRQGRCSRCDEEFPLAPGRKSYRLRPVSGPAAAIGADMPVLAATQTGPGDAATPGSLASWVAMLIGSLGALVGYYAAVARGADTWLWTATGCAAGLSAGALWIRWKSSKS